MAKKTIPIEELIKTIVCSGDGEEETEEQLERICYVLRRLPYRVQKYVKDNVMFLVVSGAICTNAPPFGFTWIIIEGNCIHAKPEELGWHYIAHEIAHGWIKYNGHAQGENEADALAEKWGFTMPHYPNGFKG